MQLSDRIEARLEELGMKQAELGRRAGIPQSTVNTMIRRGRRSSPHLMSIARALKTTPAYLLGETDDPESEFEDVDLTADERELVEIMRAIAPKDRAAIMQLARTLAQCSVPPVVHAPASGFRGKNADG